MLGAQNPNSRAADSGGEFETAFEWLRGGPPAHVSMKHNWSKTVVEGQAERLLAGLTKI